MCLVQICSLPKKIIPGDKASAAKVLFLDMNAEPIADTNANSVVTMEVPINQKVGRYINLSIFSVFQLLHLFHRT